MNIISGIRNSGFLAQSAYSADIANKDALGRVIDTTYLTAHQDLSNYATKDDLSAYTERTDFNAAIESIDSGKLDVSSFSSVSSDFLQSADLDGYATEQWVENKGYLTAVDIPESATWNATTQTVSANSAQWAGGTANPQIPVTGINGIKISESADQVVFEVSANYATEDWVTGQGYLTAETDWTNTITAASANAYEQATAAIPAPFDPSYLSGQIDTKLDSAIYANDSGSFLTALPSDLVYTADIQDMATTGDLTGKQDITGMTAYATVESLTAKQDAGNYLSASDSANFLLTSDSGNFYPMNENPSGYLTAHQSLTDYQTTADMVNYQTTSAMTGYQAAGDYYSASNPSGFITGVPDTYLQNTDLSTTDGKVTAISGIPLSAGGDVPEGVMVESGLEYNAVDEISGYNGSAFAQYGAEKQWLVHDDTLVHAANSAQYALGVNLSAVAQLLGVDETVLWSGSASNAITTENPNNFEQLRVCVKNTATPEISTFTVDSSNTPFGMCAFGGFADGQQIFGLMRGVITSAGLSFGDSKTNKIPYSDGGSKTITVAAGGWVYTKIIGIGRKEV